MYLQNWFLNFTWLLRDIPPSISVSECTVRGLYSFDPHPRLPQPNKFRNYSLTLVVVTTLTWKHEGTLISFSPLSPVLSLLLSIWSRKGHNFNPTQLFPPSPWSLHFQLWICLHCCYTFKSITSLYWIVTPLKSHFMAIRFVKSTFVPKC